jgi:ubiquinone/menaquinone biosynthesis C-methylase UbiE
MSDHDAVVRQEFSRQADAMAGAALFNDAAVLERIRDAAHFMPQPRILDVACGPGIVVEKLAPGALEAVGCDITPEMLDRMRDRCARAGLANVRALPGRAEALPFEDGHFDVVVSRSAVHHFADPAVALGEMARVTRRGGRVITVDVTAAEDGAEAALHNALEIIRDPSHVRMLPKSELHALLVAAGLRIEGFLRWTNRREFGEWMKITNAPERIGPLRVVMAALARAGQGAGIGLRLEGGELRFEHHAAMTVAVKP